MESPSPVGISAGRWRPGACAPALPSWWRFGDSVTKAYLSESGASSLGRNRSTSFLRALKCNAYHVRKGKLPPRFATLANDANHAICVTQITERALYKSHDVRYPLPMAPLTFQRARTEENKRLRAAALVEAARSLALETGVASVTLTAVASRAGIHYSAVRRYFTSHKEVLLHLAAEGWVRWSTTVCDKLAASGPTSPSRVADILAEGLADDPLFCDLLANLHLHLEHEVHIDRVVEIRRTIAAAAIALAGGIERALPALGRSGAFDMLIAAYSLAAAFWQIANPPERLTDVYAEEPDALPPEWNIDFASALNRTLTATCIGLVSESQSAKESGGAK